MNVLTRKTAAGWAGCHGYAGTAALHAAGNMCLRNCMYGTRPGAGFTLFILPLFPLLVLTGCKGRSLEEAQQEAREAKATVQKLKHNLNEATRQIALMNAEINALKQTRDDLQERIVLLVHERDQASGQAQQAQEAVTQLTTRASGQVTATAALEQQLAELKALVEEQQKLIEQLQKGPAAGPPAEAAAQPTEAATEPTVPTEPNQTP